jgi:hypothetical protein
MPPVLVTPTPVKVRMHHCGKSHGAAAMHKITSFWHKVASKDSTLPFALFVILGFLILGMSYFIASRIVKHQRRKEEQQQREADLEARLPPPPPYHDEALPPYRDDAEGNGNGEAREQDVNVDVKVEAEAENLVELDGNASAGGDATRYGAGVLF